MTGEHGFGRQGNLVSRVSFEPLSDAAALCGNGSLSRDGSGVSVDSASEYDSWRVSAGGAGGAGLAAPRTGCLSQLRATCTASSEAIARLWEPPPHAAGRV